MTVLLQTFSTSISNKLYLLGLLLSISFTTIGQNFGYRGFTPDQVTLFREGYKAYNKKSYSQSLEVFDSLSRIHPDHCRVRAIKAASLAGLKDYEASIRVFREALKCYPDYTFVQEELGHVFMILEAYDSAELYYRQTLISNKSKLDYQQYQNLAMLKQTTEEFKEAIEYASLWISDCQQSVTPESSCSDVWYQRAKSYHHLEKDSLALIDIDRHLEAYSDDSLAIALKKNIETCLLEN